jgi:hypothetical protein
MMAQIEVNRQHWPLILFSVSGDCDIRDVDQVVAVLHDLCLPGTRILNVFDLTKMGDMPPVARKRFMDDAKANQDLYHDRVIAAICVVPSRFVRGILTAMQWLFRFSHPLEMVSDMGTAMSVARRYFAQERIAWPAGLAAASHQASP